MPWRNRAATLRGALVLIATLGNALAQDAPEPSAQSPNKAALVLNFIRYTDWPTRSAAEFDQELTLCVIGDDPGGIDVAPIGRQTIQGRELRARRVTGADAIDQCEILFISRAEQARLSEILRAAQGRAILTVSDIAGFAETGGMIGLVSAGQRLQFDVNLDAVRGSGLWLSPQVLRLARTVIGTRTRP